ncbi:fluoride efflux transporter FluC [Aliidiomarina sp. Khilg15.8]
MSAGTQNVVQVFVGGVLGSALRITLVVLVFSLLAGEAHTLILGLASTLIANVLGSLLLGALAQRRLVQGQDDALWRFWGVGCLGAFTTFSGFALDAFVAFQLGHWSLAFIYGISSVVLSISAAALGFYWANRSR